MYNTVCGNVFVHTAYLSNALNDTDVNNAKGDDTINVMVMWTLIVVALLLVVMQYHC